MDAVEYTQRLIRFDTINPPGNEEACGLFVADTLRAAGLAVEVQKFGDKHINVIAKLAGQDPQAKPLLLTGHLDTVPLGDAKWSQEPLGGHIVNGKLYGRGSSDMKSGVAAMMAAVINLSEEYGSFERGVTLVFTSCEETGCEGALHLAAHALELVGEASAMIVGEPTENQFSNAHKGALYIRARTSGVTAHSSTPHLGSNAIYKAAKAINKIENYGFNEAPHKQLGTPTINVGMMRGGLNVNSVPDSASFTIDIRTNAAKPHADFFEDLQIYLGDDISLKVFTDMPAIATDIDDPFTHIVSKACKKTLGPEMQKEPSGLPFVTDASALQPILKCPTIILGPGELSVMHQTDEFCFVHRIEQAVEIYSDIIRNWCMR